jgi:hypothetical protein
MLLLSGEASSHFFKSFHSYRRNGAFVHTFKVQLSHIFSSFALQGAKVQKPKIIKKIREVLLVMPTQYCFWSQAYCILIIF